MRGEGPRESAAIRGAAFPAAGPALPGPVRVPAAIPPHAVVLGGPGAVLGAAQRDIPAAAPRGHAGSAFRLRRLTSRRPPAPSRPPSPRRAAATCQRLPPPRSGKSRRPTEPPGAGGLPLPAPAPGQSRTRGPEGYPGGEGARLRRGGGWWSWGGAFSIHHPQTCRVVWGFFPLFLFFPPSPINIHTPVRAGAQMGLKRVSPLTPLWALWVRRPLLRQQKRLRLCFLRSGTQHDNPIRKI